MREPGPQILQRRMVQVPGNRILQILQGPERVLQTPVQELPDQIVQSMVQALGHQTRQSCYPC